MQEILGSLEESFGSSDEEQKAFLEILSIILALGNLEFFSQRERSETTIGCKYRGEHVRNFVAAWRALIAPETAEFFLSLLAGDCSLRQVQERRNRVAQGKFPRELRL